MTSLALAWRSLLRRPLSSLSTLVVLGVLWACLLPILAILSEDSARTHPTELPADVLVGPKSSGLSLLLASAFRTPPPEDVIPWGLVPSLRDEIGPLHQMTLHVVGTWNDHPVVGTDDAWLHRPSPLTRPTLAEGRWFRSHEEAVVGIDVARRHGVNLGDTLHIRSSPSEAFVESAIARGAPEPTRWTPAPTPFSPHVERAMYAELVEVVGIVDHQEETWDRLVYLHRDATLGHFTHQQITGMARELSEEGPTTFLFVTTRNATERAAVLRLLTRNSVAHAVDVDVEAAALAALSAQRRHLTLATHMASALLAFTLLLLVATARFRQRRPTRELLLSLGYPRSVTARMITFELLFLVGGATVVALFLAPGFLPWFTDHAGLETLSTRSLLQPAFQLAIAPWTTLALLFVATFLHDQRSPHPQHL